VIMDLTIPGGMGGQDAVRELLQLDPAARAIVASGYSQDQVLAEFQAYGFKGVLAKPYRLQEIGRVLHQVLQPGP
jgi:two-component system cell cycle sensor histidine kinase/response regulator CckA